ncbi:MAG TPA: pentapeptide repeat-containing protein, partial [Edaphobacter sp.]|nr:pentapeptide repeat-containing protein [Edaphobacter sp.]
MRLLAALPQILSVTIVLFAVSVQGHAAGVPLSAPGQSLSLEPADCRSIPELVQQHKYYLLWERARIWHQDQALHTFDWYKKPRPAYSDKALDPFAEQAMGAVPFSLDLKKLQECKFPDNALLDEANFHGSDLTDSIFSGTSLKRASFDLWNLDGKKQPTNLTGVKFLGVDLTGATFSGADMTGVVFEPDKLPPAYGLSESRHLEQMTYEDDPSALLSLRQLFRNGGFAEQDVQITFAIQNAKLAHLGQQCRWFAREKSTGFGACISYAGLKILYWTCKYGMDLWMPIKIGFYAWLIFTILFFLFMHHHGPSGLYLAVAKGIVLEPEDIRNAPQVRSMPFSLVRQSRQFLQWSLNELHLLKIAGYFSLINGFNLGFKEADIG